MGERDFYSTILGISDYAGAADRECSIHLVPAAFFVCSHFDLDAIDNCPKSV